MLFLILSKHRVMVNIADHKRGPCALKLEAPGYTNQGKVLIAYHQLGNKSLNWACDRRVNDCYDSFFYVHDPREAIVLSEMGYGIKELKVNERYFDSDDEEQYEDEGLVCFNKDWVPEIVTDIREVQQTLRGYVEYNASFEILDIHIYPCISIVRDYLIPGWEGYPAKKQRKLLQLYVKQKNVPTFATRLWRALFTLF